LSFADPGRESRLTTLTVGDPDLVRAADNLKRGGFRPFAAYNRAAGDGAFNKKSG
jgi:hypothetical protein